ncbi:MAG TPA: glycoside hydrolase family protein [Caulobacteraceae bacterium]|nr:glycoside hydrolase family protein [Caulobacteraceae bacterium]
MTTPFLIPDLRHDEGLRLEAYPDPLSGGAPWTIGYGHTGPDVTPETVWTEDQAEAALASDVARVCAGVNEHISWWRRMSDLRQDVLANMAFNMGLNRLLQFRRMLDHARAGDFGAAADDMLASVWARQVRRRAARLARQMATGAHQTC